jgi:small-conductance mechanosensitive channel
MTSLAVFSLSSLASFGPAALVALTILAVVLLARYDHRTNNVTPVFGRRRLGLPRGVARWLVIVALLVGAMLALGIDLHGLWSNLVPILSLVAIGFVAMWSILSHMLASILIVIFRPFEVGDRVEIIGDDLVVGDVTDLNPVYTTLRTENGGILQVPNNLFFQKALKRHPLLASTTPPLSLAESDNDLHAAPRLGGAAVVNFPTSPSSIR